MKRNRVQAKIFDRTARTGTQTASACIHASTEIALKWHYFCAVKIALHRNFLRITFNFASQNFDFASQTAMRYRINSSLSHCNQTILHVTQMLYTHMYVRTKLVDYYRNSWHHINKSNAWCNAIFRNFPCHNNTRISAHLPWGPWLAFSDSKQPQHGNTASTSKRWNCIQPNTQQQKVNIYRHQERNSADRNGIQWKSRRAHGWVHHEWWPTVWKGEWTDGWNERVSNTRKRPCQKKMTLWQWLFKEQPGTVPVSSGHSTLIYSHD